MRPEAILCIVLLSLLIPSATATDQTTSAKDQVYITEQFPPFCYQEMGTRGMSVDLLEKMLGYMILGYACCLIRLFQKLNSLHSRNPVRVNDLIE